MVHGLGHEVVKGDVQQQDIEGKAGSLNRNAEVQARALLKEGWFIDHLSVQQARCDAMGLGARLHLRLRAGNIQRSRVIPVTLCKAETPIMVFAIIVNRGCRLGSRYRGKWKRLRGGLQSSEQRLHLEKTERRRTQSSMG